MSRLPCSLIRSVLFGIGSVFLFCVSGAAQINLSGSVFDGSGGPLVSGQTYIVSGALTVPLGETLTVAQGATVKFNVNAQMNVSGALDVNGAPGNRVIFTSALDDAAGGDTNGDGGATVPAAGDWRGIIVLTGGAVDIAATDLRFGGAGGFSLVHVSGSMTSVSLDDCLVTDCSVDGVQLASQAFTSLSVSDSAFNNNGEFGVAQVRLDHLPFFSNNTATGNTTGDYIQLVSGSVPGSTDLVVTLDQLIDDVFVMTGSVTVPLTSSLTLPAGVVVKMPVNGQISVSGNVTAIGTPVAPVVFTSVRDDTFAGDTNKDGGATSAAPGDWRGLIASASSEIKLEEAVLAYNGAGGFSGVHVTGSSVSLNLTDCTLRDSSVDGLQLSSQTFSLLTVNDCAFNDNGEFAVAQVRLDHLPSFSNNTASGNTIGDYLQVVSGAVPGSTDLVVALDQLINDVLVMTGSITVPGTSSMTLPAGVVVKIPTNGQISVSGELTAAGTSPSGVTITSIHDDSAGGDTNKNGGATVPMPADWRGVIASTNSTIDLAFCTLSYGGAGGFSPVHVTGPGVNLSLLSCLLTESSVDGLELGSQSFASLSVDTCTFSNNGGLAVANVQLDQLPGFSNNRAGSNALGDYQGIVSATVAATTQTVTLDQLLNDVMVLGASVTIPAAKTLQLPAGAVVKVPLNSQISVSGTLEVAGTSERPVTITSVMDDTVAGDTNKDGGATVPTPGNWRGCLANAGGVLDLDYTILRYGGAGGFAPVYVNTIAAGVELDGVRAEHSALDGFFLQTADWVRDCVAWNCGRDGFSLANGTFDMVRCTSVSNDRYGVRKVAAHTGTLSSVLSHNNVMGNYDGVVAGDLFYSLGDPALAGTDGNVNTNPLLVDEPNGDLRLTAASLCVDNGDPTDMPTGFDLAGFPRLLDGKLNYVRKVDMGAYEFDNIEMSLVGSPSPGTTINLQFTGTAGMDVWVFLGVATFELPFKTFGPLTVDIGQPSVVLNFQPIPSSLPLPIPSDFPVGVPVYTQALALDGTMASDPGNMSNPITIVVE